MTILAIVPGKPKTCQQENLVDCADCGGLCTTKEQFKQYSKEHFKKQFTSILKAFQKAFVLPIPLNITLLGGEVNSVTIFCNKVLVLVLMSFG